uniref:DUF3504 domain-containing protein n=1 Tax=Amphimedon queenslandica TaxID=400682 RepID=A0A1X7U5K4_AMPQE
MAAQTAAPNLSMAQAAQRHHHPRSQLAAPKDNEAVLAAQKSAIPETDKKSTDWACRIWEQWSLSRKQSHCSYPAPSHPYSDKSTLDSWLSKFLLEICRKDGNEYPPNTLYFVACGILSKVR